MNLLTPILLSTALHLTWFNSNFPAHVFGILKKTGLHRYKPRYWSDSGYETKFYDDWFTWVNLKLPEVLAELLTCPVCMSWHIGFWVYFTLAFPVGIFSLQGCALAVAASVILSNLVHKVVSA